MARHVIGSELESDTNVEKKSQRIWIKIIIAIVLLFTIIIGYFVYSDLKEEELLKQEIQTYMQLDFIKDNFNVEIKTSGDYALVESAIKTYFKELSDIVKEINKIENDESFINILTTENFKTDGPDFIVTLKKITDVRKIFDDNINKFVQMCSEEYMLSLITKYDDLDSYYIDLYKELMYTDKDLKDIEDTKNEMLELKGTFSVFLDDCENIIVFLKNNKGKWIIEENSIVFDSDSLLQEYNNLTSKLLENSEI